MISHETCEADGGKCIKLYFLTFLLPIKAPLWAESIKKDSIILSKTSLNDSKCYHLLLAILFQANIEKKQNAVIVMFLDSYMTIFETVRDVQP